MAFRWDEIKSVDGRATCILGFNKDEISKWCQWNLYSGLHSYCLFTPVFVSVCILFSLVHTLSQFHENYWSSLAMWKAACLVRKVAVTFSMSAVFLYDALESYVVST